MKELAFIAKEIGWANALFYFFYKIKLKLGFLPFVKNCRQQQQQRIQKIYEALAILQQGTVFIYNKRYLQKQLFNQEHSVLLRPYSSDTKAFEQVIEREEYRCVVEMYRQQFKNEPTQIFDCGANIGLASIYFWQNFPAAKFTVLEPFADNAAMIRLNFESAGLSNFHFLEAGVWNKDGQLSLNRQFRDGQEWSVNLEEGQAGEGNIKVFSLAELLEKNDAAVDILKIDIEGAETVLFADAAYAARFLSKTKCIAIEIHDEFNIRNRIYELLQANHFFFYNTNELTIGINRQFIES